LREDVERNLAEAAHLRECGQFQESRELLEEVLKRLGNSGPSDLVEQASMALSDVRLVARLDANRQRLFDRADAGSPLDLPETEKEYAAALNEAVLVRDGEEKDVIAARVRNSSVRVEVLAAIQDWAAVTSDEPRRAWLLAIACTADPDPGRDSLRRPELWRDRNALAQLGNQPVPKSLSAELAVALALRAWSANVQGPTSLLVEVQKAHPEDYWLNFTAGWHLGLERKWDEAMAYHRAAMSIRPRTAAAHYNLGTTLRLLKKLDEAMAEFDEALRLDPNSANAHNGKGVVLADQKKPDEAMEQYKEAIRLNPKHATAHANVGVRLAAKKQMDEAISYYEAALRINPNLPHAHYQYGNALRAKNKLDEAIGQCREAVHLAPGDAAAHNALGAAFQAGNRLDEAMPCFEAAVRFDNANAVYRANLANALRLKSRLDESIIQFREALKLDKNYAFARNGLGNALHAKGDFESAINEYQEAIRLDPKDATVRSNLGNTLRDLGRLDEATSQFKDALQIDRKHRAAQNGLGGTLLNKGKLDESISCLEKAIQQDAKNSDAQNILGCARLYGQGQFSEAIELFGQALRINQNNAVVQFNLGKALLADGKYVQARDAVRRALELVGTDQTLRDLFMQTMRELQDCDRLPALEARLPAILQEKDKPANAAEALQFAWLCESRLHFADAARLYAYSFEADPKPANDLSAGYRYIAARCAALAAAGWGADSPKPDDKKRSRLRELTLEWLRADLAAWQQQAAAGTAKTPFAGPRTLPGWGMDFRFFAVREKEELAKLPDAERAAWEKLWSDADALRTRQRPGK
jgi:tetratricopeptide (TPR) repeat protein